MKKVEPSEVYRLLYPSVPVVVSASRDGRSYAMPVVSIVSLSNEPPLVGFSSSAGHSTFDAVRRTGSFSVSWLDARFLAAVEHLGTSSGWKVEDKLAEAGLRYRLRRSPPVPIIEEACAWLACSVEEVRRYGDHELVVGRVMDARASGDFDGYWNFKGYDPILYTGLGRPPLRRSARVRRS